MLVPTRTLYVGVVTNKGLVCDVMVYDTKDECVANLEDACEGRYADNTTAKVYEHVDFDNGDQSCDVVYDAYKLSPEAEFLREYAKDMENEF